MKQLLVTTPGPDNHKHIVYTDSETGIGSMSPGPDGHVHDVIYDPPREPVEAIPGMLTNPQTGEQVPAPDPAQDPTAQEQIDQAVQMGLEFTPGTPADPGKETGEWIIRPAQGQPTQANPQGGELHDHQLIEYQVKQKATKEDDGEILKECLALWREGLSLTEDCRKKFRESEAMYKGKQWDDGVERDLNALDRAALTINEIGPNIDTLIGYQMEQRTDFKTLPQEGGDQRVADMLNVVLKRITDNCYYAREETKVFKDICIGGFAAFNLWMDFNNLEGDPKIERFPWENIVYGPHEKEDLSDCEYEVKDRMQSIAKLKQLFGKKASDIQASYDNYKGQYPDINKIDNGVNGTNTDYRQAKKLDDMPFTVDGTLPLVDVQRKQFRLVQVTRKTYKEVTVIFNQAENFFFAADGWEDKDIAAASEIPGFQVISQVKPRMRITKFCGNVILSDENPADLPIHDFYTVPVYAYRQNGEYWGKVEAAKDPQRELNKRRSQAMDIMNRLGASIYYAEPDTFKDPAEYEKFKKNRSKPGSIFTVNDVGRTPKLEPGADFPVALVNIMQMDQQNLQRLMNVTVPKGGANESGSLFLERKKGAITSNQFLFDNLSFAKQKLGKLLISLIQRYFPAERLERLLNSQYSRSKFKVGDKDYSEYSKDEIIEMLETADLLEYDVIVTESAFTASTRLEIAKTLFELISQGAEIPPELPLEFVDMPAETRQRITERLQQQSDASTQAAADTNNSEITKTLIAKGQYTVSPEKANELGLIPATGQNTGLPSEADSQNTGDTMTQADTYANNLAGALAG